MLIKKGCWSNKCLLFDILMSDLDLPHILNRIDNMCVHPEIFLGVFYDNLC